NESARREERVGVFGSPSLRLREVNEQEVRRAWGYCQPKLFEFLRQPGEPAIVVLARAFLVRVIFDRRDAGCDRRAIDVKRAADAVDRGDDMRRTEHPTQAQGGEAVDF